MGHATNQRAKRLQIRALLQKTDLPKAQYRHCEKMALTLFEAMLEAMPDFPLHLAADAALRSMGNWDRAQEIFADLTVAWAKEQDRKKSGR